MLLGLLLAASVFVAGHAALVAVRQEPVPTAGTRPAAFVPPVLAAAKPLAPMKPLRTAVEAGFPEGTKTLESMLEDALARPLGQASLIVSGKRTDESLGIAILDGESMAPLRWLPLAKLPARLQVPGLPAGRHWIVLSNDLDEARFAYLARARLELKGSPPRGSAHLDCRLHEVEIRLETEGHGKGKQGKIKAPIACHLTRIGDAMWHAPQGVQAALDAFVQEPGDRLRLTGLGAGRYRLELDGFLVRAEDRDRLALTLPGPSSITVRGRPR